jgi:hypothetical protein
MIREAHQRVGAACGAIFAVALFAGASAGGYAGLVVGTAALTLFVPFLATLTSVLRCADGGSWLSTTAFAAGLAAIVIKLGSDVPEIAARGLTPDSPIDKAFVSLGDAGFIVAMYPLAVFFAATGALILASGLLPRWLGVGALVTAAALAVNACFIDASFGPAFLLYLAWTLVASVVLVRTPGLSTRVVPATGAAGAVTG